MSIEKLSDAKLLFNLKTLVKKEQSIIVKIIDHLHEVERRKLYCDLKYQSLYEYCAEELGYSKDQAYRRIQAMRLAYKKPEVRKALKQGELSLSTVNSLGTFLKDAPQADTTSQIKSLVKKLASKSKRETEKILELKREELNIETKPRAIKIEIDEETLDYLKHIQKPGESLTDAIKRISKKESSIKKKSLAPKRNQSNSGNQKHNRNLKTNRYSRYIPKAVKHTTMTRAKNKCQNCEATYQLQFEHIKPYSLGGTNSVENIKVLCRNCNLREGIKVFGLNKMNRTGAKDLISLNAPDT